MVAPGPREDFERRQPLVARLMEVCRQRGWAYTFATDAVVVEGLSVPLDTFEEHFEKALARLDHALAVSPESSSALFFNPIAQPPNEFDMGGRHISEKSG